MNRPSLLVIDDEPDNFDVIEAFLSNQDYRLHYVASGHEAIAFLETFEPDVILLDVMMPGLDGVEVCQHIKARPQWKSIPIIMVTALHTKQDLARCLEAGANDFISKPVNSFELRARVQSMLRIKKQYDTIQNFSKLQRDTINILGRNLQESTNHLAINFPQKLNLPVNGVLEIIGLLKDNFEELDIVEIREMLGLVDQSARHLERLTKKFLTYVELEISASQQHPIEVVETQFSSSTIEAMLKSQAESLNRSDDLIFVLEEADITLSEQYLSTILHELIDNALKFSLPGTLIKVSSQVVEEMLHLSVHDSGQGMTEKQISELFSLMEVERGAYEKQSIGMGLKNAAL